jgi:hypothetical protein
MDRCDPTRVVHRACLADRRDRETYAKQQFDAFIDDASRSAAGESDARWSNAILHRTDALVAAISVSTAAVPLDDLAWLDHVLVTLRHVAALDPVRFSLSQWPAWVSCRQPTWDRSADPDDLAIFARELPGLRDKWPDAAAIMRSPAFEAFASDARRRSASERARANAERQALLDYNKHLRAQALRAPLCPHCTHAGPHRFVDVGDVRAAYFICASCACSFGLAPLST